MEFFYQPVQPSQELMEKHLTPDIVPVLKTLVAELQQADWTQETLHAMIENTVKTHGLKFPKVAMPLRVMMTGGAQSPSIDAVMLLLGKQEAISRLGQHL